MYGKSVLSAKVTQTSRDQTVASGSEVTLPCTFETEYSDPDLYWYRMRPGLSLEFVLYRDNTESLNADFAQGRFSVQHNVAQKTFHLVMSSVRAEDSATYYCVLEYPQ
ncbi:hypothetical protein CB1_000233028 [Camelus ferus]|nr:hypothetical protein CB1_000233028 [Camelus ferus]